MKTNTILNSAFVKLLVYANIFIAFCSLAQVLVTYYLFSIPFNFTNNSYLAFVFLSTYLQYNVQRGYMVNPTNASSDRSQWLIRYKKTMLYSVGLCLLIVLFLCNNLSWTSIGIMVGAEVVSTLYYLPPFNLRRHGYIKPFLISFIWVVSCAAVPLIENKLITINSMWFLLSQFFFISLLCLLFDFKDSVDDYMNGVRTFANKLPSNATKFMCVLFCIVTFICFYFFNKDPHLLIEELVLLIVTLLTIFYSNEKRHVFYYYLWVDGLLIVQFLAFVLV